MKREIKLNLGCASRILDGYTNIDKDSLDEIIQRYPNIDFKSETEVFQYDIFDLPYKDESVNEVRCDSLLEHLSFLEEKQFFYEMKRILKSGGLLRFSVPDFEDLVKKWLDAEDDWLDFYRNDDEAIKQTHWFGQYSYSTKSRWGYLTASLYGPQNSEGQFHKNCYTEGKIRAMLKKLDFINLEISRFMWKDDRDLMLLVKAYKK